MSSAHLRLGLTRPTILFLFLDKICDTKSGHNTLSQERRKLKYLAEGYERLEGTVADLQRRVNKLFSIAELISIIDHYSLLYQFVMQNLSTIISTVKHFFP